MPINIKNEIKEKYKEGKIPVLLVLMLDKKRKKISKEKKKEVNIVFGMLAKKRKNRSNE